MKVGTDSGAASAQFNIDGGMLTVGAFLDLASNLNGTGRDTTFRVFNGGTVTRGGGIASSYSAAGGDLSGDGVAEQADLDLILAHWGDGTPPGNVPEPGRRRC